MARGRRDGVLIAGGGVAGCLAALALARRRPDVPLLIVEEKDRFGGDGFQYLFDTELDGKARAPLAPIAGKSWPGFYVAFPGTNRKLKARLAGFEPDALHRAMVATLKPDQYRLGTRVVAVREDALELEDGETVRAVGAIDARGPANLSMLELLYETRVERLIRLTAPHGLDRPLLVDANVEQIVGFSFIQAFPVSEDRLLVAKVLVAERAAPDEGAEARLDSYLALRGWRTAEVEARRRRSRPMPIDGDFNAFWRIGGARVARIGLRGGFVQPASGRTVADAARNAALLAEQEDFGGAALHDLFEGEAKRLWKQRELERGINAALAGTTPDRRRAVYDRLYRLDAGAILGFLAGRPGLLDRRRIQQAIKSQA